MEIMKKEDMFRGILPGPKVVTLVTSGKDEDANILAVSYTGQFSSYLVYIGIRPERYSNELIRRHGEFGVNYIISRFAKQADYCGIFSGKNHDKFKATKFTKEICESGLPLIAESPLSLECHVERIFREGQHDIFIGSLKEARKRSNEDDWLFHYGLDYFCRKGVIGRMYEIGKGLINCNNPGFIP